MPTIPYIKGKLFITHVFAHMLFPSSSEEAEEQRKDSVLVAGTGKLNKSQSLSLNSDPQIAYVMQKRLRVAHSVDQYERLTKKAYDHAIFSGRILLMRYKLGLIDIPEPSIRKAIFLLAKKHRITEETLWNFWKCFKSICHLWAAVIVTKDPDMNLIIKKYDMVAFYRFLSVGKELEKFCLTKDHLQKRSTKSLVDSKALWKIPDNLGLPFVDLSSITKVSQSESYEIKKKLKDYRARVP